MGSPWIFEGLDVVRLSDQTDKVRIGAGGTPTRTLEVIGSALATLQDKGGNVFDVKAYGATGDGSTPDWSSINDAVVALVAAGGGTLYFPRGTYAINQPIVINNTPFLIRGAGPEASTIRMVGSAPAQDFIRTNFRIATAGPTGDREMYMEIRDLKFVAEGVPTAGAAILQQAIPDMGFQLLYQNTFIVRNCWFFNVWDAIHLTDTGSAVIKDCQILRPRHAAIFLENKFDEAAFGGDVGTTFIADNFIWDRIDPVGNHAQPIHGVLVTTGVPAMRIHHNSFLNFDRPIYIDLTQPGNQSRVHIDHNSIDGFSIGAKLRLTGIGGISIFDISSNDFTVAGTNGVGIQVDVTQATGLLSNAVIAGNTFNTYPEQLSQKGIVLTPDPATAAVARDVIIANSIFWNQEIGIEIGQNCRRIYVGDNAFENVAMSLSVSPLALPDATVGAFFPDRVGIGKLNDLTSRKDLRVYSNAAFRPRIYLEGDAPNGSSPGIEFAFDPEQFTPGGDRGRRDGLERGPARVLHQTGLEPPGEAGHHRPEWAPHPWSGQQLQPGTGGHHSDALAGHLRRDQDLAPEHQLR